MDDTAAEQPGFRDSLSGIAGRYCAGDPFASRLLQAGSEALSLPRGQALFRQGDPADSMYLLVEGRLGVCLEHEDGTQTQLAELGPGVPVGELALLTGQPRTASVYALTDASLVRCSRANYEHLARQHPGELAGFTRKIMHRLQQVQLASLLADLFGVQVAGTLDWLLDELEWVRLGHGDILFREGDPGEAMYIVVSGRLRITAPLPEDGRRVVGEASPGEIVGELGLLSGEPHTATATAIRETHVVRMSLPVFERLAERHPEVMLRLTRLIVKRQRRSMLAQQPTQVRALALALVPISRDVPLLAFAGELACCLRSHGSVQMLDSAHLDDALGKPGAARAEAEHPTGLVVAAWLSEQESRYRYLLYVADPDWSPWTERCVCQADRLLLLADASASPELAPVEQAIASKSLPVRQELVLLHAETAALPSGTAGWLEKRDLHAHHHIGLGDPAQTKRLARRLAGRALGLVLSGGAARGFAHLGVLRAIEERGIEVDLIGGTSMGSLIGAGYALGRFGEHEELARRLANPKHLFDYTLPLTSLMASKKLTVAVKDLYGDVSIEDLWRPFFCVSTNLTRAEAVIHRTGPLWEAVRASIAMPGIFSPILRGNDVLVDGGVMNNFPVDVMVELSEGGPVIGSSVSPPLERPRVYEFGPSISGWQVLWSRINPFTPAMKVPSLLGSLMRTQEVKGASAARDTESLANLVIRPDVRAFSQMDFAAYKPIIETGYEAAREQLAAWSGAA